MTVLYSQVVRARAEGLLTREVGDEVVVYDQSNDKAHVLNPSAAVLWRACESGATVGELRALLEADLPITADGTSDEALWTALGDLARAGLLDGQLRMPEGPGVGFSRRSLLKKLGVAAVALPAVTTILAPPAAASHTGLGCIVNGGTGCADPDHPCCSGETCQGGTCCRPLGNSCLVATTCCSGTCNVVAGTCCVGNGSTCASNAQCCAGICTGGTCQCIPNGTVNSTGQAFRCCSGVINPANQRCVSN